MTKDPSPRFLRFARALALASGVAPLGCGGNTGLHAPVNDARPGQAETGPNHGDVGFDGAPRDLAALDGPQDLGVVSGYDGRFFGIGPPPPLDAAVDAGVDAAVVVIGGGLDAAVGPIAPIGGPQAAPALPADWWGAESA